MKMAASGIFAGKVALVTGAGSGIGRAVAQAFAKEGAKIAAVDLNVKGVEETVSGLGGSDHTHYTCNVGNYDEVQKLVSDVNAKYNQPACLAINAAGITRDNFLLKLKEEKFDEVINVNLKGTFNVTQAVARAMAAAKVPKGAIVTIASIVGKTGNIGQTNYAASKSGVIGFTKSAAFELARSNIRVNCILPGFITTPMTDVVPDKVADGFRKMIPLGRFGDPAEIADVAVYLASDKSSYITGNAVEVSGGLFV